ncbi:MAG: hypothetical protein HN919_17820 [Verrucomicrobia bacterium]|jgi:hypothetical protein|nr:hypothetical protein [Verrucomicrobiota bacterium]MBT7068158.1 hypothetical protein [Verrucomicrobiota bacterium]MBT7700414.1 hypothetical protein [Verrucomicrobiota bacterium]
MNQIVIGAAGPYLVSAIIYAIHTGRASLRMLIAAPLSMALCAIWAVVPDIPRALGMDSLYGRMASDPRINIFFMHYTIDQMESDSILYTVAAVLMALSVFAVAWREVRLRERDSGATP